MSASLVGSEMCIRDRFSKTNTQSALVAPRTPRQTKAGRARRQAVEHCHTDNNRTIARQLATRDARGGGTHWKEATKRAKSARGPFPWSGKPTPEGLAAGSRRGG
eukprot:10738456-Alexandrium_andersonii.AAC.1